MNKWLNTEKVVAEDTERPCHELGWCPYGQLVEEFPFTVDTDSDDPHKYRCGVFGHDCPAFYHRENLAEEKMETDSELEEEMIILAHTLVRYHDRISNETEENLLDLYENLSKKALRKELARVDNERE